MKHTPEPWEIRGNRLFVPNTNKSIATVEVQQFAYGVDDIEGKANAARIVACVNAMAGIEDPEAYMKQLKEENEELKRKVNDAHENANDVFERADSKLVNLNNELDEFKHLASQLERKLKLAEERADLLQGENYQLRAELDIKNNDLRNEFAKAALPALMNKKGMLDTPLEVAQMAFAYADLMIKCANEKK